MTDYPTAEYPIDNPPAAPAGPTSTTHWAPLLPRPVFVGLLGLGVVVGIAGPILLWLNVLPKQPSFVEKVGFLVVLLGIGLVVISLPLLLGEAGRLERSSADVSRRARRARSRNDGRADLRRDRCSRAARWLVHPSAGRAVRQEPRRWQQPGWRWRWRPGRRRRPRRRTLAPVRSAGRALVRAAVVPGFVAHEERERAVRLEHGELDLG